MTATQRAAALVRIEAAMMNVSGASEGLRTKPRRGRHVPSPEAHYELNRIWVDLDALRKKLEAGGR